MSDDVSSWWSALVVRARAEETTEAYLAWQELAALRNERDAARNAERIKAVCDRLDSSDPDFDDCAAAVQLLVAMQIELDASADWKQRATDERTRRVETQSRLGEQQTNIEALWEQIGGRDKLIEGLAERAASAESRLGQIKTIIDNRDPGDDEPTVKAIESLFYDGDVAVERRDPYLPLGQHAQGCAVYRDQSCDCPLAERCRHGKPRGYDCGLCEL